jgi:hypothetical protein
LVGRGEGLFDEDAEDAGFVGSQFEHGTSLTGWGRRGYAWGVGPPASLS